MPDIVDAPQDWPASPLSLLTNTVNGRITTGLPGAPSYDPMDFARRPVFRVRGFTWFRAHIEQNANAAGALVRDMLALQNARPSWTKLPLDWEAKYAPRQSNDAMSYGRPRPLILVKAFQTILLCEANARARGVLVADLYANMRIEPAVFVIQGFTRGVLAQAEANSDDLWPRLFAATAQTTTEPIYELADQKPVSLRLATRVREALLAAAPRLPIGNVVVLLGGKGGASLAEDVDGYSEPPFNRDTQAVMTQTPSQMIVPPTIEPPFEITDGTPPEAIPGNDTDGAVPGQENSPTIGNPPESSAEGETPKSEDKAAD